MRRQIVAVVVAVAVVSAAGSGRADVFNMSGGQTSLQFVTVGDPGNAADQRRLGEGGTPGCGAVGYTYWMGKYDVTAAQYTQFLNAVAKTDTYGLYNPYMANVGGPYNQINFGCGITQSGVLGSYTYSVLPDSGVPGQAGYANYANFPVNYVSWGDAARFCNWLKNGQPVAAEGPGTTETGAYTLSGATADSVLMTITRNAGATYFLPSENEWYKAAYYKGGGINAGYWTYATKSNTVPSNVFSATGTNNANSVYTDPTNGLTRVGAFAASPGSYGTFDQSGDVWQWNETAVDESHRDVRGGSFIDSSSGFLSADSYAGDLPHYEVSYMGFRVASSVPEPGSITLAAVGAMCVVAWLWRRRPAR